MDLIGDYIQREGMERGVENPEIIDLITSDSSTGEVVLVVLERRPWGSVPEQLAQLDEKLNRYMVYIIDGFLGKQYPQYKGLPVRLQIDCVDAPTEEPETRFMEAVAQACEENDIRFVVRIIEPGA